MWEYNFEDYNKFCKINGLKPCRFESLMIFKQIVFSKLEK